MGLGRWIGTQSAQTVALQLAKDALAEAVRWEMDSATRETLMHLLRQVERLHQESWRADINP